MEAARMNIKDDPRYGRRQPSWPARLLVASVMAAVGLYVALVLIGG